VIVYIADFVRVVKKIMVDYKEFVLFPYKSAHKQYCNAELADYFWALSFILYCISVCMHTINFLTVKMVWTIRHVFQ